MSYCDSEALTRPAYRTERVATCAGFLLRPARSCRHDRCHPRHRIQIDCATAHHAYWHFRGFGSRIWVVIDLTWLLGEYLRSQPSGVHTRRVVMVHAVLLTIAITSPPRVSTATITAAAIARPRRCRRES